MLLLLKISYHNDGCPRSHSLHAEVQRSTQPATCTCGILDADMVSLPSASSTRGSITFFTGPMCCGKTLELVRHLHIFHEQRVPTICLRPCTDIRTPRVESRSGLLHDAVAVHPEEFEDLERAIEPALVIGIDEVQLFSPALIIIVEKALRQGKILLLSGLDTDFRGIVFPTSHAIMAIPETNIQRSRAVCAVCHEYNATRTQRLFKGEPVSIHDPIVMIEGAAEDVTYEARCLAHHAIRV